MSTITGFHVHVYFDADTMAQARRLCEAVRDKFGIIMGRMHDRPVGPHPMGSCQLTIPLEKFGPVMSWLTTHRNGLTIFAHAETGDALKDHTDHTIWMGQNKTLDLSVFDAAED